MHAPTRQPKEGTEGGVGGGEICDARRRSVCYAQQSQHTQPIVTTHSLILAEVYMAISVLTDYHIIYDAGNCIFNPSANLIEPFEMVAS